MGSLSPLVRYSDERAGRIEPAKVTPFATYYTVAVARPSAIRCRTKAPHQAAVAARFPSVLLKRPFNRIGARQTTFIALKNVPRLKWVFQIGFD